MAKAKKARWEFGKAMRHQGFRITLSRPVLVGRSRGYHWFPSLTVLPGGELLAMVSPVADRHFSATVGQMYRSQDGGLTWGSPRIHVDAGWNSVRLASGETVLLPYYLRPRPDGMGSPCNRIPAAGGLAEYIDKGVTITGWPRKDRSFAPDIGVAGFVFNGQSLILRDGTYLTTLYGYLGEDKRLTVVAAESADGYQWKIRSVIAGADCELPGGDGPSESAVVRIKDGRLLCIFRLGSFTPYGKTFSSDEGRTWTKPVTTPAGVESVEPSLAVLPNGMIALSGGRPGVYLWINADGTAGTWNPIDIAAHHTACHPREPIPTCSPGTEARSSCYTEVVALDERNLLMIYDRTAKGWGALPEDSKETNSTWVVRARVDKVR